MYTQVIENRNTLYITDIQGSETFYNEVKDFKPCLFVEGNK